MKAEILTRAKNLRLQTEEMETIKDGLMVEKFSKTHVKSRPTSKTSRLEKLEARAEFSNPTSLLTKFSVISMRVTSSIFEFLMHNDWLCEEI